MNRADAVQPAVENAPFVGQAAQENDHDTVYQDAVADVQPSESDATGRVAFDGTRIKQETEDLDMYADALINQQEAVSEHHATEDSMDEEPVVDGVAHIMLGLQQPRVNQNAPSGTL